MKVYFAANASAYEYDIIAVLIHNRIEVQRWVIKWPASGKWNFDVSFGKYNVKVYQSRDGVSLNVLINDFWIDKTPAKLPRILKSRE
jgi:hypothetical protein